MVEPQTSTICPLCKSIMEYFEDKHFWICQKCKAELWPVIEEDITDAEKLWASEQAYKRSISKPGGSRSGRRRKKPRKLEKNYWLPE